jgi:hypothetical protein
MWTGAIYLTFPVPDITLVAQILSHYVHHTITTTDHNMNFTRLC